MRTIRPLFLAIIVLTMLLMVIESPARAETILYDVTTTTYMFLPTTEHVLTTRSEVIQITDHGPQANESPRWTTESLGQVLIWDEDPGVLSEAEMLLFGNHCGVIPGNPLPRRVQVTAAAGGGNFAWMPGHPSEASTDPHAFFCLKWGHQSTTTWQEQVSIGKRVSAVPPSSQVKVFITQPGSGATVSGIVWVVLWVEDISGTSNVFTLSVDGKQIRTVTTSSRGPVAIPWPTTPVPNGTHTLTGTVRDATGKTGTTSITVTLNN
jgi:hypothetical protein